MGIRARRYENDLPPRLDAFTIYRTRLYLQTEGPSLLFWSAELGSGSSNLDFQSSEHAWQVCSSHFMAGRGRRMLDLRTHQRGWLFHLLCKQLPAAHSCTINGHLMGNNHLCLSKLRIGIYHENTQLLGDPSGNAVQVFEEVA